MSPKLYEEITTKLSTVWGKYAGWAHTVGDRALWIGDVYP